MSTALKTYHCWVCEEYFDLGEIISLYRDDNGQGNLYPIASFCEKCFQTETGIDLKINKYKSTCDICKQYDSNRFYFAMWDNSGETIYVLSYCTKCYDKYFQNCSDNGFWFGLTKRIDT